MKKRVMAVLTAVMVLAMGSMTVLAANSPSTSTTPSTPAAGQTASTSVADVKTPAAYAEVVTGATVDGAAVTVAAVPQATVDATKTAVQNQLNDLAALGNVLGNQTVKDAQKDSTKTVKAEIVSVVDIQGTAGGTVTLKVAGVKAGDTILIMHFNETTGAWEDIKPSKVADGELTFALSSFSPVAIVKLDVATTTQGTAAATTTATSPKTGEAVPFIAIIAVICLAGIVVCGKKVKFN